MASVKIKKSVGKNGKNAADDAQKIQGLLNAHKSKGGYAALAVDGDVGQKTIAAIMAFQSKVMGVKADGRVDVDGATLAALNAKPGTVTPAPDPAPSSGGGSGGASKKKPSSGSGPAGSGADKSEVEERIAAVKEGIATTSRSITDQESWSKMLRSYEMTLEMVVGEVKDRLEVAKGALAAADEQRRAKALEGLASAAAKAGQCLIQVEQDAKSIEGAKCEAGLGAEIIACGKLFLNDSISKFTAKLDGAKAKLDRVLMLGLGTLKTVRLANEAYILILKGKRALLESALALAEKDLKAVA